MKKITLYTAVLAVLVITSCSNLGNSPVFESKDGINKLIEQLKDNYGTEVAFNSIVMFYNAQIGNSVTVQANGDINSNKLIEKLFMNGVWEDKSEITVEISDGEMRNFLFTLEEVDLTRFPELVADAKKRVTEEKGISDVKATFASLTMPKRVTDKMKDLNYSISIEPENGGTTFILSYDLSGKFINIVY